MNRGRQEGRQTSLDQFFRRRGSGDIAHSSRQHGPRISATAGALYSPASPPTTAAVYVAQQTPTRSYATSSGPNGEQGGASPPPTNATPADPARVTGEEGTAGSGSSSRPRRKRSPRSPTSPASATTSSGRSRSSGSSSTTSAPASKRAKSSSSRKSPPHPPTAAVSASPVTDDYDQLLEPPPSPHAVVRDRELRYGELSVILPWSSRNVCRGAQQQLCDAWTIIDHVMREDQSTTTEQLKSLMQAQLVHYADAGAFSFDALATIVEHGLTTQEQTLFFGNVLPWMKKMVCDGPTIFHNRRVPLLRQSHNARARFTQEEAACLLCCSFFSLFPGRSYHSHTSERRHTINARSSDHRAFGISTRLAPINFDSLFSYSSLRGSPSSAAEVQLSKVRCLLQYYLHCYQHIRDRQQPCIEVSRVCYKHVPSFAASHAPLQPVDMRSTGLIEDDDGALQTDFANKVIGGGALGRGCVQEEIRFVVSPELLLSRLVCETILDNEVVFISGAGQFSAYAGYGSTFRFAGPLDGARNGHQVGTVRVSGKDRAGRKQFLRDVSVVAMDAVDFHALGSGGAVGSAFFSGAEWQYEEKWLLRETQKAFIAFHGTSSRHATLRSVREGPIATGNWGCGVFGGDVELKLLLQWCAASEARRPMHYYVFDRVELPAAFLPVQQKLTQERWTVGELFRVLLRYKGSRTAPPPPPAPKPTVVNVDGDDALPQEDHTAMYPSPLSVFDYVLQCRREMTSSDTGKGTA